MSDFNDILNLIKDVARQHEEPYKDGAWEVFLKTKKKKRRAHFVWPLIVSGVAASLIVAFIIISNEFVKNVDHAVLQESTSYIKEPLTVISQRDKFKALDSDTTKRTESQSIENSRILPKKNTVFSIGQNGTNEIVVKLKEDKNESFIKHDNKLNKIAEEERDTAFFISTDTIKKPNKYDEDAKSLLNLNPNMHKKSRKKRLTLGVSISPLLTSNENGRHPGISAGIQTDIPISEKVSINSGFQLAHQKVENIYKYSSSTFSN